LVRLQHDRDGCACCPINEHGAIAPSLEPDDLEICDVKLDPEPEFPTHRVHGRPSTQPCQRVLETLLEFGLAPTNVVLDRVLRSGEHLVDDDTDIEVDVSEPHFDRMGAVDQSERRSVRARLADRYDHLPKEGPAVVRQHRDRDLGPDIDVRWD
jgi:hypothetical protein